MPIEGASAITSGSGIVASQVRTGLSAGGGSLERTRLWTRIPCLSGKLQGILSIRAATSQIDIQNNASYQQLRVKFPTRTNRELSNRSRELNRRIRECSNVRMFWPDEVAHLAVPSLETGRISPCAEAASVSPRGRGERDCCQGRSNLAPVCWEGSSRFQSFGTRFASPGLNEDFGRSGARQWRGWRPARCSRQYAVVARPTDVVRYRRTAEAQCRAHPAVD
jgi:hypothetical protein